MSLLNVVGREPSGLFDGNTCVWHRSIGLQPVAPARVLGEVRKLVGFAETIAPRRWLLVDEVIDENGGEGELRDGVLVVLDDPLVVDDEFVEGSFQLVGIALQRCGAGSGSGCSGVTGTDGTSFWLHDTRVNVIAAMNINMI